MAIGNNGGMRRALIGLLVVFTLVFSYLYWNQMKPTTNSTIQNGLRQKTLALTETSMPSITGPWTWVCINNHCERHSTQLLENKRTVGHSLRTCNMLCGSTQLWPQPTGPVSLGSKSIKILPDQFSLDVQAPSKVTEMVDEAFDIFKSNVVAMIENPDISYVSDIEKFIIKIVILKHDTVLTLNTSESYNLNLHLTDSNIVVLIHAETYFGARHGLETLSQLIWWDDQLNNLRVLKVATVQDKPKFAYRGLMLDTSRNFFSAAAIKRTLDGMAASKLNIFHWHISDSQSFPFDAPRVPEMVQSGMHNPRHIYSARDVEDIAEYAKIRGIRVVIEIDTPAHVGMGWTWGPSKGLGELAVCVGQQPWNLYCGEPPCGQLNPKNPNVYKVLENLYKDIIELTKETEIFHIGGDEVNLECWGQHKMSFTSTEYAGAYTDLHDLWGNFTVRAIASLKSANKNKTPPIIIIWSSNLTKRPYLSKYLDPESIVVQAWGPLSWAETSTLWENGYRTILSHVDAWYLDCGFGKWRETGGATCDPYRTWQKVYSYRPWVQAKLSKNNYNLVLGAEACLWSEQVEEGVLDSRLWPRAAAFAERLWSDIPIESDPVIMEIPEDTYTRLDTHRNRLKQRGISAEAMWPEWCTYNPGMCL